MTYRPEFPHKNPWYCFETRKCEPMTAAADVQMLTEQHLTTGLAILTLWQDQMRPFCSVKKTEENFYYNLFIKIWKWTNPIDPRFHLFLEQMSNDDITVYSLYFLYIHPKVYYRTDQTLPRTYILTLLTFIFLTTFVHNETDAFDTNVFHT